MKKVVQDCIKELKRVFRDGIEERCRAGANKAKTVAVETSDTFAASMHWASYRASMCRSSFFHPRCSFDYLQLFAAMVNTEAT
jgi:L-ribulose-5-phosphate 3-epimerase UlaE